MRNLGACGFCPDTAITTCQWPVLNFRMAEYRELHVGDRVRRAYDRTGRPPASIADLQPLLNGFVEVTLLIGKKTKVVHVCLDSPVQVECIQPCLMPACENHLRCVEPGVEYCMDHWKSWEAVA